MTINYSVSKTATHLLVTIPYNPNFIRDAKTELGGRWSAPHWVFDLRDEAEAMALIARYYDWSPGMRLVSAKVVFNVEVVGCQAPVVLLGRVLAVATGRDSGAKCGDGVRLRAGTVTSGGSVKNWTTVVEEGTELAVHDVPESMVQNYVGGRRSKVGVVVEFLETVPVVDIVALRCERTYLLERIAEIDALLATGAAAISP